ncbi:MAG: O-antigen ligase family protein [Nitrospirota bacterium]
MKEIKEKIYFGLQDINNELRGWAWELGGSVGWIIFFFVFAVVASFSIIFYPPRNVLLMTVSILWMIAILLKPHLGVYAYYVIEIIGVQYLVWTAPPRLALYIALTTAVGASMYFLKTQAKFVSAIQNKYILLLWILLVISAYFAPSKTTALEGLEQYTNIFIFYFISINLINSKKQFKYAVLIFTGCFTLLALRGVRQYMHGSTYFTGIGGLSGDDNTTYGLCLVMGLPFVFYPFIFVKSKIIKVIGKGFIFPFLVVTTICTFSRGALLGLIPVMFFIILHSKRKIMTLILIIILSIGAYYITPQKMKERAETIKTYQEEGSAMQRINAWQSGLKMIKDYPVMGVGLRCFGFYSWNYSKGGVGSKGLVAHNSFISMAAENGLIAFTVWMLLIITSFYETWKLKKRFKNSQDASWIISSANLIQASLSGYMVSAFFLTREGFEFLYFLFGLTVMLKNITKSKEKDLQ